ncbi:unnamed protein product [Candida verbasci]|uniref:NAD(P)-binding protein n=1 Tax=Candida verbasci TaxID=1227364 RepID=A0A9W4TYZ9_9ASCO|nr:unnamed protein product [Candida verbasci]
MLDSIDQLIQIVLNNGKQIILIQIAFTVALKSFTLIPYWFLLVSISFGLIYKYSIRYNLPNDWTELNENDICLITGGSNGLGLEIVKNLLAKKVIVYNFDISPSDHDHAVNFIKCNIGIEEELKFELNKLIESLRSKNKYISIVINNAGIRDNRPLITLPSDRIHQIINVNLFSQIWIQQTVLNNHLQNNPNGKLSIVNMSSILGTFAPKNLSIYCGSKAASIQIHDALVQEFKRHEKIRFLLITTGQLNTSMFNDVIPSRLWFAPIVDKDYLSNLILEKINTGYSGIICEPFYANFLPSLRCFPMWFQDLCRYISEIDDKIKEH